MNYTKMPLKKTLIWVLVPVVIGLAFVAFQATVFAYGGIAVITEPIADPLEHTRGESELPWLFAVFIITWGAFFGYVFAMSRRQREMRREIDVLRRVLAEREGRAASGDSE